MRIISNKIMHNVYHYLYCRLQTGNHKKIAPCWFKTGGHKTTDTSKHLAWLRSTVQFKWKSGKIKFTIKLTPLNIKRS